MSKVSSQTWLKLLEFDILFREKKKWKLFTQIAFSY